MEIDKAQARSQKDKQLLNKELGKNQPGSPKSVEKERLARKMEGKHTHPKSDEKPEPSNAIPAKRYPTSPFGE